MKLRNSFISNSSSSSFVIRGVEVKKAKVLQVLGLKVPKNPEYLSEAIDEALSSKVEYKKGGFTFLDTRDFFDGESTSTIIVGINQVDLDDGCVTVLPEIDDFKVIKILKEKLNLEVELNDIHTYIQYISNDNY